jgi:alpha-1,4-digalacturonate transport system permease protein
VALIWKWILQRDGVLNAALVEFGLERTLWLVDRGWAMFWAIFVSIWAHLGFYALILLAGLQAIPRDLYEAAEMDGTGRLRTFRRITLPLLWPNLVVVIILALIRAVQIFDEAFVLTGGGPGTSTMFITQYIYETGFAHVLRNLGLASAASILMGVVLVGLTALQLAASNRRARKEAA